MAESQGSIAETGLPALIARAARRGQTGRLQVVAGPLRGSISFAAGAVVAADAGPEEGLAALDALLVWATAGQYVFVPSPPGPVPPPANITLRGAALNEHVASLAQRGREIRAAVPSLEAIPRRTTGAGPQEEVLILEASALTVLRAVDGRRSVFDLARGRGLAATVQDVAELQRAGQITLMPAPAPPVPAAPPAAAAAAGRAAPAGRSRPARPVLPVALAALAAGAAGVALVATGVARPTPPAPPTLVATAPAAPPPTAAVAPTPTPAPAATAAPPPPATVLATQTSAADPLPSRLAAAETALRTGRFESAVAYSEDNQTGAVVLFDLGGPTGPTRLRITSTYRGPAGTQVVEQILIGEQAWERRDSGPWAAVPVREGARYTVQGLLPRAAQAGDAEIAGGPEGTVLRWYEPGYDADVVVYVDPASGVPTRLERTSRPTGSVLRVSYLGWNTPVDIAPPPV